MIALVLLACLTTDRSLRAEEPHGDDLPDWVRVRAKFASGDSTIWFSPKRKIWIRDRDSQVTLSDGGNRIKFNVFDGRFFELKYLGEENPDPVFPRSQLTAENQFLGAWFLNRERITDQKRHEIVVDGKTWIEIEFGLVGRQFYRGRLRVDPMTRRPVHLVIEHPVQKADVVQWGFDYPDEGPANVPQLDPMVRKLRTNIFAACQKRIDTIAAHRAQIGDLRLVIASIDQNAQDSLWVVSRKGDRWRVDTYSIPMNHLGEDATDVETDEWEEWITTRMEQCHVRRSIVCDGNTVFDRAEPGAMWSMSKKIAPLDLMAGSSHLPYEVCFAKRIYPDQTPDPYDSIEYDLNPPEAPGCVLFKSIGEYAGGTFGHCRSYFDPSKGNALVKFVMFDTPTNKGPAPDAIPEQMRKLEEFKQSPQGWWYPSVIRHSFQGEESQMIRYHFDFNPGLADSLFTTVEPEE